MKKFFLTFCLIIGNICFASEVKILHTSDIHGRIVPIEYKSIPESGGFARRVNFVNEIRKNNKNVLLLDSGDYFQGSLYYRLDKGKNIAKLMPCIKYDAVALGNHEFDNGLKILKQNIKLSDTQFLSANVHFKDRYLNKAVKPYITKDFDGENFLIIGITTPEVKSLSSTNEITVTEPIDEIKKIISQVKYDKLIVISHCGYDKDKEIANSIPQIDLILGGHNHYFFEKPKYTDKTPIIEDGEFGVRIGVITFDKVIKKYTPQNINNDIKQDLIVKNKISKIDNRNKKVTEKIIGTSRETLIGEQDIIESHQTNLGRLVLNSMAKPFEEDYDGVITNSGSIRINRNLQGNITYADLLEILPFDNDVVMVEIKGKDLKQALKYGQEHGRHYLQYYLKNNDINDNKTYKIITNNYVASGKDGYESFKNTTVIKRCKTNPVRLLEKEIKKNKEKI